MQLDVASTRQNSTYFTPDSGEEKRQIQDTRYKMQDTRTCTCIRYKDTRHSVCQTYIYGQMRFSPPIGRSLSLSLSLPPPAHAIEIEIEERKLKRKTRVEIKSSGRTRGEGWIKVDVDNFHCPRSVQIFFPLFKRSGT